MKKTIISFIISAITIAMSGCGKKEDAAPTPTTDWEITVKNASGAVVNGAKVTIYKSSDDWRAETNGVSSATTGSDGKVTFKSLDETTYYANVVKDAMSNWEGGVTTFMNKNKTSLTDISILENKSFMIGSVTGKKWKITSIQDNAGKEHSNDSAYACVKDDQYIYYKGGKGGDNKYDAGSLSCSTESSATGKYPFGWSYDDTGIFLRGLDKYDIISISSTEIKVKNTGGGQYVTNGMTLTLTAQ